MAVERTYYCDGPECDVSVRTAAHAPTAPLLVIIEYEAGNATALRHFHSWDCVLRYAATQEPTESIEAD